MANLYQILEIPEGSSVEEAKEAFRDLAKIYHPDAGSDGDEERFQLISEAHEILSNPEEKRKYDLKFQYNSLKQSETKKKPKEVEELEEEERASEYLFGDKLRPKLGRRRSSSRSIFGSKDSAATDGLMGRLRKGLGSQKASSEDSTVLDLREERVYRFTIDALESIRGAERELVLPDGEEQKKISIEIPAGVQQNEVLALKTGLDEHPLVKAQIKIEATEYVFREGADIVLRIPITIAEALNGSEIEVPVVDGKVKLKLGEQKGAPKRLRIANKGVTGSDQVQGDIIVAPYLVLPDKQNESVRQMGAAMADFYLTNVRSKVPNKL